MARLATADAAGHPHVVPVCFARVGTTLYVPIDAKPKRASPRALRRLRNLQDRPEATLLLDHYDEDWTRLRWLMIRARATILDPAPDADSTASTLATAARTSAPTDDPAERARALAALERRYPQYAAMALARLDLPVIALTPTHVARWRVAKT